MKTRALLLLLLAAAAFTPVGAADAQQQIPLWTAGAPGATGQAAEDQPTIAPYLLSGGGAPRTAVVVFPGGGYGRLALDHEGEQVARWLNANGISAFVVRYRLGPKYQHPTMLNDAKRAVRTVRARAAEWGVDPQRIGVIGFSAGGHLVSTAGTHFDRGQAGAADPIDRVSSRPDFMMLIYPVITLQDSYTHRGSKTNLLGAEPDPRLVWLLSNENQVTPDTPPAFLVHTTDDAGVPVENSLRFYRALREARVPVEMHIYETGRHGLGLGTGHPLMASWPGQAVAWMRSHGWVAPAQP